LLIEHAAGKQAVQIGQRPGNARTLPYPLVHHDPEPVTYGRRTTKLPYGHEFEML
jgi:hypothetical protein